MIFFYEFVFHRIQNVNKKIPVFCKTQMVSEMEQMFFSLRNNLAVVNIAELLPLLKY